MSPLLTTARLADVRLRPISDIRPGVRASPGRLPRAGSASRGCREVRISCRDSCKPKTGLRLSRFHPMRPALPDRKRQQTSPAVGMTRALPDVQAVLDPRGLVPNEIPLTWLHACRDELLAARKSIDGCLEALDRGLGQCGVHESSGSFSDRENQEYEPAGIATSYSPEALPAMQHAAIGLSVDQAERVLRLGQRPIPLTNTEFAIVAILWTRQPQPVSRDEMVEQLYTKLPRPSARTVDPFISRVRQKLRIASGGTEFIEAVRGRGWRMRAA
jgi:two-component system, cell cycle response regulator CtrA